jgi:polyhydroxyalkanoate synthesis regulator phasin
VSASRPEGPRPVSELLFAGLGVASLGAGVADELADDLARRMGLDRDAVRGAVRDTFAAWRAEAEQLGMRRDDVVERSLEKAGIARREAIEDLELRVAQVEHRLRLLEDDRTPA